MTDGEEKKNKKNLYCKTNIVIINITTTKITTTGEDLSANPINAGHL